MLRDNDKLKIVTLRYFRKCMLSPVRSLALKRLSSPGFDGNLRDGDGRIEYHLVLASAGRMPPTLGESLEPSKKMVERLVTRHDPSLPMDLFLVLSFVRKTDLVRQAFIAVFGFDKTHLEPGASSSCNKRS